MQKLKKRLLLAAAICLVACFAVVLYVGAALIAPAPSHIGPPPEDLPAETVQFESESGGPIHGWWIPAQTDEPAVVLAHSLRANRQEMLGRARFLHEAGYSVLLFDAQAHGASPGNRITFGFSEALDARAAVEFAAARRSRVVYLGCSLGGAAALLGSQPLAVDALILEAVYPTLREATHNRIELRCGILAGMLAPLLLCQVELRLGISPDDIAPIEGLKKVHSPVLIIAGEFDQHTTLAESQRMFAAANSPKELWVVPGAAHVNFHRAFPAEYERRVLEFLLRAGL